MLAWILATMSATSRARVGLAEFRERRDTRTNGQHYTAADRRSTNRVSASQAGRGSRPPHAATSSLEDARARQNGRVEFEHKTAERTALNAAAAAATTRSVCHGVIAVHRNGRRSSRRRRRRHVATFSTSAYQLATYYHRCQFLDLEQLTWRRPTGLPSLHLSTP